MADEPDEDDGVRWAVLDTPDGFFVGPIGSEDPDLYEDEEGS